MVVPTFVKQALTGRPITIYGDGSQSRCFTDVTDVTGALMKLMDHPGAVGEVFNIGSSEEVTIRALAEPCERSPALSPRSSTCRTNKPTARDSKTCRAGFRISARSQR